MAKKEEKVGPYDPDGSVNLVPVVTLKAILSVVPQNVRILQLKSDIQGHDFRALYSAGEDLGRIDEIFHECQGSEEEDVYETNNRYKDWKSYMNYRGFVNTGKKNHDCHWIRKDYPKRVEGLPYIGEYRK